MKKLFGLFIITIMFTSCTQITPTEEGFKISNSGDYRGVDSLPLLTGINFFMPGFTYIVTIPTTMQHTVWTELSSAATRKCEHCGLSDGIHLSDCLFIKKIC